MNLFKKKKYITLSQPAQQQKAREDAPQIPDGMWVLCPHCKKTVYKKLIQEHKACPNCGNYFRLSARERIALTADEGTFTELNAALQTENVLSFPDYEQKLESLQAALDVDEAVITGSCQIGGKNAVLCVMDSRFIMGSMGRTVGERVTLAFEYAAEQGLPVVIFTASGGARMQEGILSLMQMAKTSGAVKRHSEKGLLYITVLTEPTTGGVTASFAMLGDIILAEPKAVVGFAGRRVIEQTMKQKLPSEFQTAEFVQEHGFIDRIVPREELKQALTAILAFHDKDSANAPFQSFRGAIPVQPAVEPAEGLTALPEEALSPMDIVQIARKVTRPTSLDFIDYIFDDFIEFSGDRCFADDAAIVGGIAYLGGKPVTVIGTQKGKGIEENIQRNFGQPNPEGYRKALRLMRQAEKFGRPVVALVNTSGAYCGMGAEERGQGEAIARNLYEMSALKTPIISVMTGEGGSGGALALAVADRVWALEYAVYSILSPEGFASILWKDSTRAREAADIMRMTAKDLLDLKVIEKIIPEANGGCQNDFEYTAETLRRALAEELEALLRLDAETLVEQRYQRFRSY